MLTIILLTKLVAVILAFTIDNNTIMKSIDIPVWDYARDPEIQVEMDSLQVSVSKATIYYNLLNTK